jgi:hypothetical protein
MAEVSVKVNGIAGNVCEIEAMHYWTVRDLKAQIQRISGISCAEQSLLYGCVFLLDEDACLASLHSASIMGNTCDSKAYLPSKVGVFPPPSIFAIPPSSNVMHDDSPAQILQVSLLLRSPEQANFLALILKDPLESHNHLSAASVDIRANKELVMFVVRQNGYALMDAASELKADEDVVLAACAQNAHALQFASPELRSNKRFVERAAYSNCHVLRFAAESVKADKELMLKLVEHSKTAILYVGSALKSDEEFR